MRKRIPAGKGSYKAGRKTAPEKIKSAGKKKETDRASVAKTVLSARIKPVAATAKTVKSAEKKAGRAVRKAGSKGKTPAKKVVSKRVDTPPPMVRKKPVLSEADNKPGKKSLLKKEKPAKIAAKAATAKSAIAATSAKKRTPASSKSKESRTRPQSGSGTEAKTREKIARVKKIVPAKANRKEQPGTSAASIKATRAKRRTDKKEVKEVSGGEKVGIEIAPDNPEESAISGRAVKEDVATINPPNRSMPLPEEYGENAISLLTVNPSKLFAFWEIRKDMLSIFEGQPELRVYDVTDANSDYLNAEKRFEIEMDNRVGDRYVRVTPGREYVADIGILYDGGIFISLARSVKASTPYGFPMSEKISPAVHSDADRRVGY